MLLRCIGGGDGDSDGDSGGGGGGDGDGGSNPVLGAGVTLIPASMLSSSSTRSFVTSAIVVRTLCYWCVAIFLYYFFSFLYPFRSKQGFKYDSRYRFKYSFLASLCALYAPFTFLCNV